MAAFRQAAGISLIDQARRMSYAQTSTTAPDPSDVVGDTSMRMRRALVAAETTLHLIERTAHIGTYDLDVVTGERVWSDELYRILGLPVGSPIDNTSYVNRVHPEDLAEILALRDALHKGIGFRREHRIVLVDGTERWIETSMQAVVDAHGSVVRLFGTGVDITTRKTAELKLAFLAHHDALTGLPNRTLLAKNLAEALAAAGSSGRHVAVVYVDLDDFKRINDTYGHAEGDLVIRRCAQSLTSCMRAGDVVARVGGDEFVVILADMESNATATHAVGRMRSALAEPMAIGTFTMRPRASFGISCFPGDGDSAEQLIQYADLAMYHAKNTLPGDFAYFEPALHDAAVERLRLEHELADAIHSGELVVHYQPIIDAQTGRIGGVEALVRWPHPTEGLKPAATFIRAAEDAGLIIPLGDFVLREATRAIARLQRGGHPELRLSVNLSPKQLNDSALPAAVRSALSQSGMPADRLDLEITEPFLVADPLRAAAHLAELSRIGVRIGLDDFGSGYSALTYLRRFPVHLLKLGRTFVAEAAHSETGATVAAAIVDLSRKLGIRTVAAGVETAHQHHVLAELRCDAFQGFYFAPPMTAAELVDYLEGSSASSA